MRLRGDWGTARFSVEVADTAQERSRGLMFRESLPRSAGMLFVYPRPQRVSFWMRNTPLPLDLLFVDAFGAITRIYRQAIPFDESPIPGGDGVLVVLEINGGLSDVYGFRPGDQMQHPAFDQNTAVWPCSG